MNRIGTRQGMKQYFKIYTILFAVASLLVFCWYFFTGRTLIWRDDGWNQHFRALVYYAEYLRGVFNGMLQEHKLILPAWDFAIGEGSDILQTLHYYVMGDPFAVFSVFVPVRYLHHYYDAAILLRMYAAGAAFSLLCFETGKRERSAVLAGSITYIFCQWAVLNAARHPYFINPMIYLPLMICGIERIIRNRKPVLLILSVFIAAVSNFYFFYMLVLAVVIYTILRLLCVSGNWKTRVVFLFRIGTASVTGVLLAAVILLPVCYAVIGDSRMTSGNPFHFLYPLSYYSSLPGLFIAEGSAYWMCMGYAAPVLPAVMLLFFSKKNRLLKMLFFCGIIVMLVPFFGQAFHGFSYMANRWSFAFALVSAYILTVMWPSLLEIKQAQIRLLTAGTAVYGMVCMIAEYSRMAKAFLSISLVLLLLMLLSILTETHGFWNWTYRKPAALGIVLISICCNSFWMNAQGGGNYAAQAKEAKDLSGELGADETAAVLEVAKADEVGAGYRYSGRSLSSNAGILAGISSTQYYWTLSNPYINAFRKDLGFSGETLANHYTGYDDRSALASLSAVRYFTVPDGDTGCIPYGFTYVKTSNVRQQKTDHALESLRSELHTGQLSEPQIQMAQNRTAFVSAVYRNDYVLPLAYTYDSYVTPDVWKQLSSVEKQEAMLQGVLLEDDLSGVKKTDFVRQSRELAYQVSCNDEHVSMQGDSFVVTQAGAAVTLSFRGFADSETYFLLDGLNFQGVPAYDRYFGQEHEDPLQLYQKTNWDLLTYAEKESIRKEKLFWSDPVRADLTLTASNGQQKTLHYFTNDYSWYRGQHDFCANLGYSKEPLSSVTITFSNPGIYTFTSMRAACWPVSHYADYINSRKENVLDQMKIGTDEITGTISLDEPKLLCVAVPYSSGWNAYVDGKQTAVYRANMRYMAIEPGIGTHQIRFVYHRPLQGLGFSVSLATGVGFVVWLAVAGRNRKRSLKTKEKEKPDGFAICTDRRLSGGHSGEL